MKNVFPNPKKVGEVNETLLVLISKLDKIEFFKDFQPISFYNIVFKIITKTMTTRFKSHIESLIRLNQCNIISRRHNLDNIIIAQETIHTMRKKMKKKKIEFVSL